MLKKRLPSSETAAEIWEVEKQAKTFLRDEDTYWAQRAKADWLAKDNKTPNFFIEKLLFVEKIMV